MKRIKFRSPLVFLDWRTDLFLLSLALVFGYIIIA